MGGIIGPRSFLGWGLRRQVERLAAPTEIVIVVPSNAPCTQPDCGLDPVTGGAVNPLCLVCMGRGVVVTRQRSTVYGRVSWIRDENLIPVGSVLPTGGLADCQVQLPLGILDLVRKCETTENAYFIIDDQRLTVRSVVINRVEGVTSLDVRLSAINPDIVEE